jgi:hypothetical protein
MEEKLSETSEHGLDDNIKLHLQVMGQRDEDCIHLAEDRVHCNLELNMAVNLWGP